MLDATDARILSRIDRSGAEEAQVQRHAAEDAVRGQRIDRLREAEQPGRRADVKRLDDEAAGDAAGERRLAGQQPLHHLDRRAAHDEHQVQVSPARVPPVLERRCQALVARRPVGQLVEHEQESRCVGEALDQREDARPRRWGLGPRDRIVRRLGQRRAKERELFARLAEHAAEVDGVLVAREVLGEIRLPDPSPADHRDALGGRLAPESLEGGDLALAVDEVNRTHIGDTTKKDSISDVSSLRDRLWPLCARFRRGVLS